MSIHVALLRGINVGGNNKIPMAELRDCLQQSGLTRVTTYIASGNVVFDASDGEEQLAERIAAAIAARFALAIPVVVRTADELQTVQAINPFAVEADDDPKKVHVFFFDAPPSASVLDELLADYEGPETARLAGRDLYVHFPEGLGRSKFPLAKLERRLAGTFTGRNWNTVEKLCAMVEVESVRPS